MAEELKLSEEQLAQVIATLRTGLQAPPPPPPSTPPEVFTGRDAAVIREVMHDECEKLYERFKRDQERLFKRLRMPIDEDHINETSDNLSDLFELNRTIKSVTRSWWKDLLGSILKWLGALALAAGAYTGVTGGKH